MQRIVYPICPWVFFKVLGIGINERISLAKKCAHLVKCAHWCDKYDGVEVVEVRRPGVTLSPGTTYIVDPPGDGLAMDVNRKIVFDHANSLNACIQDII